MTDDCRTTKKNTNCGSRDRSQFDATAQSSSLCPSLSACLSFGRRLEYDLNGCLVEAGTSSISDGWYGQVQVVNGCIVGAAPAGLPVYTAPPCAPVPDVGGSSGIPPLSPDPCNLLQDDSGKLLATINFGTLTGITVSGCGSLSNPINLSVTPGGAELTYIQAGTPSILTVSGTGPLIDPYIISITDSPLPAGTYGGFTTDAYGRIVGFTASSSGVTNIIDGFGTTATINAGIAQIDLTTTGITTGAYQLGGYSVTYDSTGRASDATQNITLTAGTYPLGNYDVTVNEFGSITNLLEAPPSDISNPTTFTKQFPADASGDTERVATATMPVSGVIKVVYDGYLGTLSSTDSPGVNLSNIGVSIDINGSVLPNILLKTAITDTIGMLDIIGVQATSAVSILAGTLDVTVSGPDSTITENDGVVQFDIVGIAI